VALPATSHATAISVVYEFFIIVCDWMTSKIGEPTFTLGSNSLQNTQPRVDNVTSTHAQLAKISRDIVPPLFFKNIFFAKPKKSCEGHLVIGSARPEECLGKSYSRKKTGRSDGFAGWLLLSLERWQLYVCISSQKRSPNQARMDPWPSGR
jgi:hypothetical protein